MKRKYKKGFTIMDMLVIVAIIGILVGITIVYISNAREKADLAAGLKFADLSGKALLIDSNTHLWNLESKFWETKLWEGVPTNKYCTKDELGSLDLCIDSAAEPYVSFVEDSPSNNSKSIFIAPESNGQNVAAGVRRTLTSGMGGGCVTLTPAQILLPAATTGFTFMAWVKPVSNYVGDGWIFAKIAGQQGYKAGEQIFVFYGSDSDYRMRIGHAPGCYSGDESFVFPGLLRKGVWQHVAVVRRPNSFDFYFNGSPKSSGNLGWPDMATNKVAIGTVGHSLSGLRGNWNGGIEEVYYSERILTSAEIQTLYIASAPKYILADAGLDINAIELFRDIKGLFVEKNRI